MSLERDLDTEHFVEQLLAERDRYKAEAERKWRYYEQIYRPEIDRYRAALERIAASDYSGPEANAKAVARRALVGR